jgi:hypothetical protein
MQWKGQKMQTTQTQEVIGQAPDNHMKDQSGLDEIDRWAMGIGNAERKSKSFSVTRAKTGKSLSRRSMQG